MTRPRLLDLYSCAGGAAKGYADAGFEVVGVDINPQPRYPYEFHQADAMAFVAEHGHEFDAIHASPPCQGYTTMTRHKGARKSWPKLIGPTRAALRITGKPYVIENVPGARVEMEDALTLHGGMFGLKVDRPRLFETNFPVITYKAPRAKEVLGVYGGLDGRRLWTRADGSSLRAPKTLKEAQMAMGMHWGTWDELREAIPPAYAEYIGRQMLDHITHPATAGFSFAQEAA